MIYLTALFISPLYFLIRGKWLGFFINSIFYGTALILLITFVGAFLAPLPWMIGVAHAMWSLRREMMEEHATIFAKKMSEAMREPPQT